ncbi:protein kinase [Marinicella sediminis]|uniref:Protein kinase n=1 Tax=Marinicella sediminis TaxID=1792834 RepID=A0ABV7JBD6_9GAMM|nr:serine/threonine-protein kinase [Marinicella sediminis]
MDLNKLKQANDIFELLAGKESEVALQQLNTYEHLDDEVLELVKSLINNHQQDSIYFSQQVSQLIPESPDCAFVSGDTLGGYQLLEVVGHGGMSTVFKANRIDSDSQKSVAIKVFSLSEQNTELQTRFLAEQKILASLNHPNIVDFHHGETTTDGQSYLVMELLENALPLDAHVSQNKLTVRQIIALIRQAAEGLMFAHNHLIIHRDIKPSNLLITPQEQLKILDFGIAKLLTPGKQHDPSQTLMALTPHYASPEQINAGQIDVTSDVFSLAAVAVYLLTGQQPFPANRLLNNCLHDEAHVNDLLNQALNDRDLRQILRKALSHDRTRRYQNMFAFDDDLANWLASKPVTATADSWWYRLNRFAVRRRALFTTLVLLLLTVITAVSGLSWQNQAIRREAQKADAVKEFMLNAFSVTNPNTSQGVDLSTRDLLKQAAAKITDDQNMDRETRLELYQAMANAHGNLGYYPEAINLLNTALELDPGNESSLALLVQYNFVSGQIKAVNEQLADIHEMGFSDPSHKAAIKRVRSNILAQAGEHEQAMLEFELLSHIPLNPKDEAHNQALLAEIHYLNGQSEQSIAILEKLKADLQLPETDVFILKINSDLVQYHDRVGQYSKARELTEQNISTFQKILGDQHPDLGLAYNSLSVFQRLEGQLKEALDSAEKSKQLYRQRYGEVSEGLAQAHSNAGMVYYLEQDFDQAVDSFTIATEMLIGIFSPSHPEALAAQYNLATILNAIGRSAEAITILETIYQIELDNLGISHRSPLFTQQSMALTLAKLERHDEAIKQSRANLQTVKAHYADRAGFILQSRNVLARVLYMAGEYQEASALFTQNINQWTEGNENERANMLKLNAMSLWHLNQATEGNRYFQLWLTQLKTLYGPTDEKHLSAMLEWARLIKNDDPTQSSALSQSVRQIITDHNLDYPAINQQLNTINQH